MDFGASDIWDDSGFKEMLEGLTNSLISNYDTATDSISSYNHFIKHSIPDLFLLLQPAMVSRGTYIMEITLANPIITTPRITDDDNSDVLRPLLPQECRLRNLTYWGYLLCEVHFKIFNGAQSNVAESSASDPTASEALEDLKSMSTRQRTKIPLRDPEDPFLRISYISPHISYDHQARADHDMLVSYKIAHEVRIARMPIMTKSCICNLSYGIGSHLDEINEIGGIFIVGGQAKIMIGMSTLKNNRAYIFESQKYAATMEVRSCHADRSAFSTATLNLYMTKYSNKGHGASQDILVNLPFITKPIPLAYIIIALGWNEIMFKCAMRSFYVDTWPASFDFRIRTLFTYAKLNNITCEKDALLSISAICNKHKLNYSVSQQTDFALHTLNISLLPHVDGGNDAKCIFLAYNVGRMLRMTSDPPLEAWDDRDSDHNKRFDLPGPLWASLMRQVLSGYMDHIRKLMEKAPDDVSIESCVRDDYITPRLCYPLSTGQWNPSKSSSCASRKNVVQPLQTMSALAIASHQLRRATSVNPDGKHSIPRQVHPTSIGIVCPFETPEGKPVGLITHQCFGDRVSLGCDSRIILRIISTYVSKYGKNHQVEFIDVKDWLRLCSQCQDSARASSRSILEGFADVFRALNSVWIDGQPIGWTHNGPAFVQLLRLLRSRQVVDQQLSIYHDEIWGIVHIETSAGRSLHPLLNLENPQVLKSLCALVQHRSGKQLALSSHSAEACGALIYVDAIEMQSYTVAFSVQDVVDRRRQWHTHFPDRTALHFTHMEIHPSFFMSISAALIPFSDHNQSPRNAYQSAMAKQAIDFRIETNPLSSRHVLNYPQIPLVPTRMMRHRHNLQFSGLVPIVAIMMDDGMNQEDAISISQRYADFGAATSTYYKSIRDSQKNYGPSTTREIYQKPDYKECTSIKHASSDHILPSGLPMLGTLIKRGGLVIGKTNVKRFTHPSCLTDMVSKTTRKDNSIIHMGDPAVVHYIGADIDGQGNQVRRVILREERPLQRGDKITTDHSQKGCVGNIFRQEDAPFTAEGISPDIKINPIGIVGRQTVGQQLEILTALAVALDPSYMRKKGLDDSTPYSTKRFDEICAVLVKRGFSSSGKQRMTCGKTGKMLDAAIFMGPAVVHKLRHMICDKIHARDQGPVNSLTRQPVPGRSEGGGLRFGEMERDACVAYGVAATIRENLGCASDPCDLYLCHICGSMLEVNVDVAFTYCRFCQRSQTAVIVKSVYSFKLLALELAAMGIRLNISVEKVNDVFKK